MCILSLHSVSCLTGSHVQVSIGGSTYSHGKKVGLPEPAYHAAPVPAPVPHVMPMKDNMPMDDMPMDDMPMDDMPMDDMPMSGHGYLPSPAPFHHVSPAPAYHVTPAPAYHVTPAPTYHVTPTYAAHPKPVYKAHPKPVYHSKLAYTPVVHPKPAYPPPVPAYHVAHVAAPAYHHPAPAYHAPKHNCSIVTEMEKVEICTPAFETKCMPVDLMVKRIMDKEQCEDITRTVCMESIEVVDNEICTYSYMPHTEDSVATTVEITFEKKCMTQMVTVCQPKAGITQIVELFR